MDKLRRAGPLPERLMPGSIDVGSRAAVSTARAASGTFVRFHDGWAAAHGNPAQRARAAARAAGVAEQTSLDAFRRCSTRWRTTRRLMASAGCCSVPDGVWYIRQHFRAPALTRRPGWMG